MRFIIFVISAGCLLFGIFLSVSLFEHLLPAVSFALHEHDLSSFLGAVWVVLSFLKGIALMVFGVGLFFKWLWIRKMITMVFSIALTMNIIYFILFSSNFKYHAEQLIISLVVIIMYFVFIWCINSNMLKRILE